MSEIKYSELDFALIKQNLKTFLKSQDKFKDYNFDGSSMSVLLDVLAYNTAYNSFYLNMVANEMFLDSAAIKENVFSRAKHLGYTPRSTTSIKAKIDFQVTFQSDAHADLVPTNFALSKNQEFYTTSNDTRYTFFPRVAVFFEKIGTRTFIARNVELVEGKRFTHSYTVDTTLPIKQKYVIPNSGVDTSTILVTVRDNANSSAFTTFLPNTDINLLDSNSPAYFIETYNFDGDLYEIVFGDNIVGKGLVDGNIVSIEYIASTGDGADGASVFKTGSLITSLDNPALMTIASAATSSATTLSSASGYAAPETIESVKLLAPRFYESQNRAVTKNDYETLILKDISLAEYVRVWGGEENVPPEYGKVFCAIKPKTGTSLNLDDKTSIINSIRSRNLVSLEVIIVEPEYIGLSLTTQVNYNSGKTVLSADSIKSKVNAAIQTFKEENISGFDSDFRFSTLSKYIDAADASIVSNISDVGIKYKIIPTLNSRNQISIVLNNEIDTGDSANSVFSITSSQFYFNNNLVSLADDGRGKIVLYYISSTGVKVILNDSIGTVFYENGTITIQDLLVSSIPNNQNYITFFITPKYNDIIALRNQMLILEDSDIDVTVVDISKLRLS